jgi:hypothetical protein
MSTQFTYYMTPEEIPRHDAVVMAECDAVIVSFRDGRLVEVQDRVATAGGKMLSAVGFTQRKWVDAIVTETYDTPKGLHYVIDESRSPMIEACLFPSSRDVLRRQRLYSVSAADLRGRHVSLDIDEYARFAARLMRRWKKGLKYIKGPELPSGYYTPGALDAISRGLATPHRIETNRIAGANRTRLGSAAVPSTAKQLSTRAQTCDARRAGATRRTRHSLRR